MERRALTAAEQYLALRTATYVTGEGRLRRERLTWRFPVRPDPLGRSYVARLDYASTTAPRIVIETPDLVALAAGRRIPHVYSETPVQLCLYLPDAYEWTPDQRLDRTIVPWTALWLFYFEEWLWSGEWRGGGVHPGERPRTRRRRRMSR